MEDTSTLHSSSAPRLPLPLTVAALVLLGVALVLAVPGNPDWWQIVVLGVVQGITEWLPISSTGHLLIVGDLLGFEDHLGGTFEIFIQFGTVLSVIAFYLSDLLGQARALIGRGTPAETEGARRLWVGVLLAMLPAGLIGVFARDFIKAVLYESALTIGAGLVIGGLVFLAVERWLSVRPRTTELGKISLGQALAVGVAQITALVPGVSRSGASIVGGLFAGLDRRTATAFSFYLSIPTLGGATLIDLLGSLDLIQPGDWSRLLLGVVVAMIVGYLMIGWLLRYVARNTFVAFGVYRIIVGLAIIGLAFAGWL
jgi:undecaprenyl-diphosphatase